MGDVAFLACLSSHLIDFGRVLFTNEILVILTSTVLPPCTHLTCRVIEGSSPINHRRSRRRFIPRVEIHLQDRRGLEADATIQVVFQLELQIFGNHAYLSPFLRPFGAKGRPRTLDFTYLWPDQHREGISSFFNEAVVMWYPQHSCSELSPIPSMIIGLFLARFKSTRSRGKGEVRQEELTGCET